MIKNVIRGSYSRQLAFRTLIKRHCSVGLTEVSLPSQDTNKENTEREDKLQPTKSEEIILNFFNKCDRVTLNKLMNFKPRLFKDYDLDQVFKTDSIHGNRLDCIDDFVKKTELQPAKFDQIAESITELRLKEGREFGLILQPRFVKRDTQMIDKVVVLDMFHGDTAWCVRSTHSHKITDIGFKKLNLKGSYHHVNHHNKIARLVDQLPHAEVYLLRSNFLPNQSVKYAVSQGVTEAVVATILNERHRIRREAENNSEDHRQLRGEDENTETDDDTVQHSVFDNRVYMWKALSLHEFYDVTIQGDMLSCAKLIRNWYREDNVLIDEWGLSEARDMFLSPGSEQLAVCTLISDVFCRCLRKQFADFPHAYSK